jgi:glucosamine--fructose-6-phosphate aminotransferase (isomerizing)
MNKAEAQTLMYAEAAEAAATVERQLADRAPSAALARRLAAHPPAFVATAARGSSDHAATFAKYVIETRLGRVTASASPSVSSVYGVRQQFDGALFIAISQSGQSPDLIRAARAARAAGAHVAAFVNAPDSPLADAADSVVPLRAGAERSVAATKSCLGAMAAILHLVALWSDDRSLLGALDALPEALRAAFAADWSPLVAGLADAEHLFVLGRGIGLAAAQETALKFKETCGLYAEAYSTAEVRHGPMALLGPHFPALLLAQDDSTLEGALETGRELRAGGARVFTSAPRAAGADALEMAPAPHPLCAPLIALQSLYRAANALSLARGYDPDAPPHLGKITQTV